MCYLFPFLFFLPSTFPTHRWKTTGRSVSHQLTSSPAHQSVQLKSESKNNKRIVHSSSSATTLNLPCSNSCTYNSSSHLLRVPFYSAWVRPAVPIDLSALWDTATGTAAAFLIGSALRGQGPAAVQAGELGIVMSAVIHFPFLKCNIPESRMITSHFR